MKLKLILSLFTSIFLTVTTALAAPINVNKATADEISNALPGIGPVKAQAIVKLCHESKCSKPEDLLQIKGIGEKTLSKISTDLKFKD